jgi:hypothetical protein
MHGLRLACGLSQCPVAELRYLHLILDNTEGLTSDLRYVNNQFKLESIMITEPVWDAWKMEILK